MEQLYDLQMKPFLLLKLIRTRIFLNDGFRFVLSLHFVLLLINLIASNFLSTVLSVFGDVCMTLHELHGDKKVIIICYIVYFIICYCLFAFSRHLIGE